MATCVPVMISEEHKENPEAGSGQGHEANQMSQWEAKGMKPRASLTSDEPCSSWIRPSPAFSLPLLGSPQTAHVHSSNSSAFLTPHPRPAHKTGLQSHSAVEHGHPGWELSSPGMRFRSCPPFSTFDNIAHLNPVLFWWKCDQGFAHRKRMAFFKICVKERTFHTFDSSVSGFVCDCVGCMM